MSTTDSQSDSADNSDDSIDAIDRQILELVEQRRSLMEKHLQSDDTSIAGHVDQYARRIEAVVAKSNGKIQRADRVEVLKHVSSACLASIRPLRAAYLGPMHSYSHLATIKYFGDAIEPTAVATIESVFDAIEKGEVETGVVPIENSTDGRVVDTLGIFVHRDTKICGEVLLPIHHNLLSKTPRSEITEVHSKPQALSQCRDWLARNLPSAKLVETSSTTAAAIAAAKKPGVAAVASMQAGRQYDLDVVQANIEDNPNNVTRFAVLGSTQMKPTGNDKTAILFQINHQPGALADAMMVFKESGLNLTWIESFPSLEAPNEYLFFIELTGHTADPPVAFALEKLSALTFRQTILGSYPKAVI